MIEVRVTSGRRAVLAGVVASLVTTVAGAAVSFAGHPHPGVSSADHAVPAQAGSAKPKADKPSADKARAEIIVLHATNDKKGIDPKIGRMPELAKPPFSSYDSYRLLDRAEIDLAKGQAASKKLPDDGQLAVTLGEIAQPEKKGDPVRYGVGASIKKPGGKTFLPGVTVSAKKGEYFFVAGQTYDKGILVIGIKIVG
jgi:hypothetical protein